jgi:two-component system NtrC family sensor kinase
MKIEINFSSFRFRIIITLVLVITTISFLSFSLYNHFLSRKIYKNAEKQTGYVLHLFRDQIIAIHDGTMIKPILREMNANKHVLHSYLINPAGKVIFSDSNNHSDVEVLNPLTLAGLNKDISLTTYQLEKNPYTRAVLRFRNGPTCVSCHPAAIKTLGYIVMDMSMDDPENTVIFTQKFSLAFTVIMILLILGLVLVLHYKIIRRSLSKFQETISSINSGNLETRIKIPKSTELGKLGKSFNEMVDQFQNTQKELQKYHQQEILNTQRLASIGEMSARLAHEIRNPITGIANAIEIIIEETRDEENKPVLEEIQRQANRVNKAVSNLLNYSRTKELNVQEADINEIIKSVVFFLENQSPVKKIRFRLDLDTDIPFFEFDPEQIENVLSNLGLNAIYACNIKGTITFETKYLRDQRLVKISVIDTGAGIPEEKRKDIFKPFYTTRTQGTGLGLAIAKEIIEMHRGEIWVENNPAEGCAFHITLPVAE